MTDDDEQDRKPTPRMINVSEAEATAIAKEAARAENKCHALGCILPGGGLYKLAEHVDRRFAEVHRALQLQVNLRWAEILATPAAIIVSTLLVLLYFHLHR